MRGWFRSTKDRESVYGMLGEGTSNRIIDAFEHEGLPCLLLCITQSHYTGYVQLPEGFDDSYVNKADLVQFSTWGEINYGPDRANWLGFSLNRDPSHQSFDGDGNPLENCYWFKYIEEFGFRYGEGFDKHDYVFHWDPDTARKELESSATAVREYIDTSEKNG